MMGTGPAISRSTSISSWSGSAALENQKVRLGRPYYSWRIRLNWPDSSEIAFGAVGFTQTLRAEPVLSERQHLSLKERGRLTGR